MKSKALGMIALGVISLSLAACSPEASSAPEVNQAPATSSAPATRSAPIVSGVPKPSPAQEVKLLTELGKVHPALDHRRSVARSRNVCNDILNGEKEALILDRAHKRFEGGSTGPLTNNHARKIVAVIKANGFCVKN